VDESTIDPVSVALNPMLGASKAKNNTSDFIVAALQSMEKEMARAGESAFEPLCSLAGLSRLWIARAAVFVVRHGAIGKTDRPV
jgi:hypothetical protein